VPPLKKTMHSHDVYFKPERICTNSVVESGFENAAVEDVVAEKGQEIDTLSEKSSKWRPRKGFPGTQDEQYARSSGRCG